MVRISNLELINLLRENSRTSYVDLARHFRVSETAVRKRMKKLEDDGVIRKYTIEIEPKKLGMQVNAIIGVDTKPEKYMQTIESLRKMEDVMNLFSSSGDHMILAECWFKNSWQLGKFIKEVESMEGVTRTCPAIIVEKIK